jgi:hypothetical protein
MMHNFFLFRFGEYTYSYLANSTNRAITILKFQSRRGCPQSDWFSGNSWGSPIASLAPPVESEVLCH